MTVSIVIPTYNEEKNIEVTLLDIQAYFQNKSMKIEIWVIDDGSKDRTPHILEKLKHAIPYLRFYLNQDNHGKGAVIQQGMLLAQGQNILFMDADSASKIEELDKLLPYFKSPYDIVMGSRRIQDAHVKREESLLRHFLGEIYIFLATKILNIPSYDYNCGFKAFRKEIVKPLFSRQRMMDWSFDVEIFLIAKKLGLKIKEVPINWTYKSTSKVRPVKDGIKSFLSLLRIKKNDLKGLYQI